MKLFMLLLLVSCCLILPFCNTPRQVAQTANKVVRVKTSYFSNVSQVISTNCVPCHIPSKGGFKKDYSNYAAVKGDIDEILRRIQLEPSVRGFMPFKRAKLSDSAINVFKQWKADGLIEF